MIFRFLVAFFRPSALFRFYLIRCLLPSAYLCASVCLSVWVSEWVNIEQATTTQLNNYNNDALSSTNSIAYKLSQVVFVNFISTCTYQCFVLFLRYF